MHGVANGHILKNLLIMLVTMVVGGACCMGPIVWVLGRIPADRREVVPGLELGQVNGNWFSVEPISNGHQFSGRPKFNEAITRVAVCGNGETLCIEFSGDLGVLYAVYPNRTGLVKPALWDTMNGVPEPWPDWLGYVGDSEALGALVEDPAYSLCGELDFEYPLEFLRMNAQ